MQTPSLPEAAPAVLIRILDREARRYCQQYPFLHGPDKRLNQRAREMVRRSLETRAGCGAGRVTSLSEQESLLDAGSEARVRSLMERLGIALPRQSTLIDDFGWKMARLPKDARRLLSVGTGNGEELLFLRSIFPEASISSIDWAETVNPKILKTAEASFEVCDFTSERETLAGQFDLIFSNHVLEHMYDPDFALKRIQGMLRQGGTLASALPLDGDQSAVFIDEVIRFNNEPHTLHACDFLMVDVGHPWKTNVADLHSTLIRTGLTEIQCFSRGGHISRHWSCAPQEFKQKRDLGVEKCKRYFGLLSKLINLLFPTTPPIRLLKLYCALACRVWYGPNRLKNATSPEVFFLARSVVHA